MRKLILLLLLPLLFSCTNYYYVQLNEPATLYSDAAASNDVEIIPSGYHVMIKGKKAKQ